MLRKMKQFSSFVLILFLVSCGGQFGQMSAVDKAGTVSRELTTTYFTLYNTAKSINETGTEVQKEYMKQNVNPKLNKAKQDLILLDKAVLAWKESNFDTNNTQQKIDNLSLLLQNISALIIKIMEG